PEEVGDPSPLRLFGGMKSNIGPLPPTLSYRIDERGLHWGEVVYRDVRKIIEGEEPDTKEEEACRFIEEVLPIGKRVQTTDLDRQAKARGFTGGTWGRAKKRMRVKSERVQDVHPPMYVSYRE
ncbi:MAG: hypothetical protein ACREIQ_10895, partial [Nitrospiria bacterium]